VAGFDRIYLSAGGPFIARSLAYLLVWSVMAILWLRAKERKRALKGASAAGLIVYGFSVSLAATDWIASLVPHWYSSGLGLLVAAGQMLGGMALGIASAGLAEWRRVPSAEVRRHFHDLGNLLLMYVLVWAYLAFTQFLITWAANLPREIAWYVPRLQTTWRGLGLFLAVFHFFMPLAILLSRTAKRSPRVLACIAIAVLAGHAAAVFWLVIPSLRIEGFDLRWTDPVILFAMGAVAFAGWRHAQRRHESAPRTIDEVRA